MYKKDVKRILSGGLNLLTSADVLNEDDAQQLLNIAYDSMGSLRSRRGHTTRFSVGARPVAMIKGLGGVIVAAGGSVYKDGAAIIGGVSSDVVGLAAWKDFVWAMSTADQRKSDGASDWRWIPEAPTDAPTIAPASEVSTPIVDFAGGFTVDPSGDENYDSGGLEIVPTQDTVYSAVKDVALDLGTGHSLDDVHKITVWAQKWKRINEIIFEVDVNGGDFTTDYYTARMSKKIIKGARKEAITFYLRKRPQEVDVAAEDKKRYGWFDRIGQTANKDWSSIAAVRIKIDFAAHTTVRIESWSVVGDAENTIEGDDIGVYYTYTTDAGHESSPSPKSNLITVNRSGVAVTEMVASGDAQVTGQNVYLTGGTLGTVLRVNTDPIVGTTYNIIKTFEDLTALNLPLEIDHDDPPATTGLIGAYFGRLVAFGASEIFWTALNKPYAFPGSDSEFGNHTKVDESVGTLKAATMRPGMMWIYGDAGVIVLQGDPDDLAASIHTAGAQMGVRSPNGVAKSPRGDYANMSEGVHLFSGDGAQKVSAKIQPVFKGGFDPESAAVGYRDEVVWISDGSVTYRYEQSTDRWFQDSRLFSCFLNDGTALLGGLVNGDIVELESGFTDNGSAFAIAYKSKAFDVGILDNEKTWEDFTIWVDSNGAALTVTAYLNDGEDDAFTVVLGVINSTSKERFVLQFNDAFGVKARNCAIGVTGSVSSECIIYEMALNYYIEAREAKSFDSDEMDFGTHKMKLVRKVYADIDSIAAATLTLLTDQPGFEMAVRDTGVFGASTTRHGDLIVFEQDFLAHNSRYVLDGEDFRLYGMRALIQIIGTYLHGSKGEFWKSDPLDFGTERVKLMKELEVVYSMTSGSAQLKMETELPSGALAEVTGSPFTLSSTGGTEQTRKIRLAGPTKGRLSQFTVTPTGDIRIEAIRVFFKIGGTPNATGWEWYPLPVEPTQDAIWSDVFIAPDEPG